MSQEDGTRFSPQPTKNKSCCSVNGCSSRACRDSTVRFHSFPKPGTDFISFPVKAGVLEKMSRRDVWIQRLMMDKTITENSRVCSLHFKRNDYILPDAPTQKRYLKRNAIPSCNLPHTGSKLFSRTAITNAVNDAPMQRLPENNAAQYEYATSQTNSLAAGNRSGGTYAHTGPVFNGQTIKEEPRDLEVKQEPQEEEMEVFYKYSEEEEESLPEETPESNEFTIKDEPEEPDIKFESVDLPDTDLNSHLQQLWDPSSALRKPASRKPATFRDNATQTDKNFRGPKFTDIIKSNKDLNILTGIPSFSIFDTMVDAAKLVSPRLARARGLRLDAADRIILTFMKLKQDLSYDALSAFFKCSSRRCCKRIILQTIETLSRALKFAIRWPSPGEACGKLPQAFPPDLADVRCAINRIEIAVRRPKEIPCRTITFSGSKRFHSVKFMTAVTPVGFVCFLSRAYGGRTSHRTLFEESHVVELLRRHDALMLLKDFPIDDICRKHDVRVVKSLYSRGAEDFQDTRSFRVRLNVNRRLLRFRIFRRKLTNTLALRTEEILTILCAVHNLSLLSLGTSSCGRF